MGELWLNSLKWTLIIIAGHLTLAMACGTIFGSYFSAKKKFIREVNDPKFMAYQVKENADD